MQRTITLSTGLTVKQGIVAKCVDEEDEEGQCARAASEGKCSSNPKAMVGPCKVGLNAIVKGWDSLVFCSPNCMAEYITPSRVALLSTA